MIQLSQVLTPNLPLAVSNSPEHTWSWSRDPRAEDVKLPKRTHAQGRVAHRAGRAPLPYLSPHDDARVLIGWEDKTEGEPALLIPPSQPLPHWPLNQASQHTQWILGALVLSHPAYSCWVVQWVGGLYMFIESSSWRADKVGIKFLLLHFLPKPRQLPLTTNFSSPTSSPTLIYTHVIHTCIYFCLHTSILSLPPCPLACMNLQMHSIHTHALCTYLQLLLATLPPFT